MEFRDGLQAKDFLPTSLPGAGNRAHHPPGPDGARPANLLGVAEQLLVAQPGHLAQQGRMHGVPFSD
ncbi:MAG: hypothetical protein JWM17_842 [Actinobacteria bacterium]|nr:hypothetical protein [Actinomycetota bacterium]